METKQPILSETALRTRVWVCFIVFIVIFLLSLYFRVLTTPPKSFSQPTTFEVTSGMSVRDITQAAQNAGIVRSDTLLYAILTYSYDPTDIYAGVYNFSEPTSVFGVAKKLANKEIENNLVRVTIPEGVPMREIATIAQNALPNFDAQEYHLLTKDLEGYLFPETYFVPETFSAEDLVALQKETFEEAIAPLQEAIKNSQFTEYEVLILASILEREANDQDSMKLVSGILQNRLSIDMALQADATIEYALDTPLNELPEGRLASELRETDSLYNTYRNPGLVPTPIGNPGIMAIDAVVHPTPSDYFFYITAPDGTFYYAQTFAEHSQNIARYLR